MKKLQALKLILVSIDGERFSLNQPILTSYERGRLELDVFESKGIVFIRAGALRSTSIQIHT